MYVGSQCPVYIQMLKVFISAGFHVADVIPSTKMVGLVWYDSMLTAPNGNNTEFFVLFE